MALSGFSKIYPKYKEALLYGSANTGLNGAEGNDGVFVALVDADIYTFSDSHINFSDLTGVVASDGEIINKTITAATFDGDDVTFASVSGATVEALVLYRKAAGVPTKLIAYIEEANVTNLPLTPNSGEVKVLWNASGIFTL